MEFRLSNVLLSDGDRSNDYPDLYFKYSKPVEVLDGSYSLSGPSYGKYDFATYFNAFSNIKWRRYTVIDNVHLRIVAKGDFLVEYTAYEATQASPKRSVLHRMKVASVDEYSIFDFEYPSDSSAAIFAFEITTYSPLDIREIYYFTDIDESYIRNVELSVATTTFKKEEYIIPNIELIKDQVIDCSEPIARHFTFHVIDNGRTLDVDDLQSSSVLIHPNPNVGGAGGFTRGIIESMEQERKATHVILMDDDVQISPESLKRTFNLLSLVNQEYERAFISGAMLSFERQDEFYEDIGYVQARGIYGPIKNRSFVSKLQDIVKLETVRPRRSHRYAGWWYCCVPISSVEEKGLPLPLFIRGDDAEYGNRCADKFITLNGICIWHLTLAFKFRAAFERYQVPRNSLIAQSTTGVYEGVDFIQNLKEYVQLDFKTFNYDAVELSLQALEDYMKGPSFVMEADGGELIGQLSKKNDKLLPIEEFTGIVSDSIEFDPQHLYQEQNRSLVLRAFDYLTVNGHRCPDFLLKKGIGIVPYDGWFYAPNQIRRYKELLSVTHDGSEAILRRMDRKRFKSLYRRYKNDLKIYEKNKDRIREEYASARPEMTSLSFWKSYLGMK